MQGPLIAFMFNFCHFLTSTGFHGDHLTIFPSAKYGYTKILKWKVNFIDYFFAVNVIMFLKYCPEMGLLKGLLCGDVLSLLCHNALKSMVLERKYFYKTITLLGSVMLGFHWSKRAYCNCKLQLNCSYFEAAPWTIYHQRVSINLWDNHTDLHLGLHICRRVWLSLCGRFAVPHWVNPLHCYILLYPITIHCTSLGQPLALWLSFELSRRLYV